MMAKVNTQNSEQYNERGNKRYEDRIHDDAIADYTESLRAGLINH